MSLVYLEKVLTQTFYWISVLFVLPVGRKVLYSVHSTEPRWFALIVTCFQMKYSNWKVCFWEMDILKHFFYWVVTSFQQRQNAGTGQVKYKKDINFNLLLRIPYVSILFHEFKSKTRQSRIYAENPRDTAVFRG